MRLSNEAAYEEFQGNDAQMALNSIAQKLDTTFTSIKLKDWGGQGLIIWLECPIVDYNICAKIPHFNAPGLIEAKHAIVKEAQINEALTKLNVDCVPHFLCYAEDGTYLVREYVEGSLLDEEIRKATPEERIRLSYLEWEMATKVFRIVHENEQQPYVIRDLKAKNMILSPKRDKVYLIDLGSCRREDNMISRRKMKMWQRFGSGKFLHWPLEQLTEDKAKCSRKVDYFAFGVLVYETIFNRRPYTNKEIIIPIAKRRYDEEYMMAKDEIQKAVENDCLPTELAELMIHALHPEAENRSFIPKR